MPKLSSSEISAMVTEITDLANSALVEIAEPGPPAPNGDTTPVPVWAGAVLGFLARERRVETTNGMEVLRQVNTLRIYDAEGAPTDYLAGADWQATTVVVEDRRGGRAARSRWTVNGADWTADGTLDSYLLELDAEVAL